VRQPTIARNYAETLFTLAVRHGQPEEFGVALEVLAALLESDARVRAFIESPKIAAGAKKAALARTLGDRVPPFFVNFVKVVLDKRREALFTAIAREYVKLLDEHLGRLHAQVTLACRPTSESQEAIVRQLSSSLGKEVIPQLRIDENILGGIVVRYGDHVLDGSLRRRLLSLRNRLRQSGVALSA
jgi:F-type H+-transporting ATPase subunit delta